MKLHANAVQHLLARKKNWKKVYEGNQLTAVTAGGVHDTWNKWYGQNT